MDQTSQGPVAIAYPTGQHGHQEPGKEEVDQMRQACEGKAGNSLHNIEVVTQVPEILRFYQTPHKKVYMLYELEPSTELTGGAWYTDNEMDMGFIESLSTQVYKYIVTKVREMLL